MTLVKNRVSRCQSIREESLSCRGVEFRTSMLKIACVGAKWRRLTASETRYLQREMNTPNVILVGRSSNRRLGRALRAIAVVAVIALVCVLSSAAFGANPAEEMAKVGAGGIDPKGNSWLSIEKSLEQFAHPSFILRLFLSLTLAVGCAFAIAWHPRRASIRNPLADFEERKALILLGVVGAVVAELSGTSQTLAFVIFGIGALLRFRTVLDNPKLTGKAIMVVVVGLACGMGSWAMAVFVTAFSWSLMFWLDSHSSCRVRIRLTRPKIQSPSSMPYSPCLFHITASCKAPHSTRTKDGWYFSCTSQVEWTRRVWSMK